jgi:hypothetical protein
MQRQLFAAVYGCAFLFVGCDSMTSFSKTMTPTSYGNLISSSASPTPTPVRSTSPVSSPSPVSTPSPSPSVSPTYAPPAGSGTTWFIRTDGGTSLQCTGKTNAPYTGGTSVQWKNGTAYTVGQQVVDPNNNLEQVTTAGTSASEYPPSWSSTTGGTSTDSGSLVWRNMGPMAANQNCAVNHPFWLVTRNNSENPFAWVPTSGDTVQFEDVGPYYLGSALPNNLGTTWLPCVGNASGCTLPAIPNNVSILGLNAGNCHNSSHTALTAPTVLSAVNGAFEVINLQGTNNVTLQCLEVTQPDTCTLLGGSAGGQCQTGTNNFGSHGIRFEYLVNQGPANTTMKDIAIVGMGSQGLLGSHINVHSTDVFNASDIYVIGNGAAGWDSDGGGCGTSCESVGTMNLSYVDVEWNGCNAVKPYNISQPTSANAFNYCYDDSTEGYGDGFAFIAAGNVTLNVSHGTFKYNTQDGFDSLHLGDDLTTSPSVNISDSWSEGNEGQTFKLGSGAQATAINNVSISNCRVLQTASNFPNNPAGWSAGVSDVCRAAGDQWALAMRTGSSVTLENNTSLGYGTTMYDMECATGENCQSANGPIVTFKNNISIGYPDPGNGNRQASGIYLGGGDVFANTGSSITHNLWFNMATGCPGLTEETNAICSDPHLVQEASINTANPNLSSGSPAIGAGVAITGITTDYNGVTRPNPPAIGAL